MFLFPAFLIRFAVAAICGVVQVTYCDIVQPIPEPETEENDFLSISSRNYGNAADSSNSYYTTYTGYPSYGSSAPGTFSDPYNPPDQTNFFLTGQDKKKPYPQPTYPTYPTFYPSTGKTPAKSGKNLFIFSQYYEFGSRVLRKPRMPRTNDEWRYWGSVTNRRYWKFRPFEVSSGGCHCRNSGQNSHYSGHQSIDRQTHFGAAGFHRLIVTIFITDYGTFLSGMDEDKRNVPRCNHRAPNSNGDGATK